MSLRDDVFYSQDGRIKIEILDHSDAVPAIFLLTDLVEAESCHCRSADEIKVRVREWRARWQERAKVGL